MANFKIWEEVGPPKGTVYNYPVRPWHEATYYVPGQSAPPEIAVQIGDAVAPGAEHRRTHPTDGSH